MATPETVRVYAVDENSDPLEGVLVRAYDSVGTFVTQNTTSLVGGEAYAEITLDGDPAPNQIPYTIRLSKNGVAFDGLLGDDSRTPQAIEVYSPASGSPTGTNYFQVQGQTFTRPASVDPRMCLASGFFRDVAGRPLASLSIRFKNISDPLIVDGEAVVGGNQWGQTDEDGYFEVELFRGAELRAQVEGFGDDSRVICVPDLSSCNLVNLLFPAVGSVTYGTNPVTVAAGSTVEVDITVLDTAGFELDPTQYDTSFLSDEAEVATAQVNGDGKLVVTGVAAGSCTIEASRYDDSIVHVPDIALDGLPVTVT